MAIAGTLKSTTSTNGLRVGASADEVADLAIFAAQQGGAWDPYACTALVWALTNLAGVPLNRKANGDMTVNDNPLTPYWSTSASFAGYTVSADTAGDGWAYQPNINASNYGTLLKAGDVLRIVANKSTATTGVHSMIVSRVEGSGPSNIWVVDNWSGGKITEHKLTDVVAYMNGYGGIKTFNVQRLDESYVTDNVPKTLAGWGEGNFDAFAVTTKPDLSISSGAIDDITISHNQEVEVFWTVDNKGTGVAAKSYASVYLSKDQNWSNDDLLVGGEATSELSAGGRDTGEDATFTLGSNIAAGTYYVLVVADSGRIVTEASESNNVWSVKVTVSGSTPRPDLVIENFKLDDYTIRPGQTVKASWEARNVGNAEADDSVTFLFLSKDRNLSSDDRYLDQESLGSMSVGERDAEFEFFTMPSGLAKGRYNVGGYIDADLDVNEGLNENNNLVWITIEII